MGSVASPHWSPSASCATLQARHLDGAPWVLEFSGEADIATMPLVRQELSRLATSQCEHAVLDVSRLMFCDVASAHLILTARRMLPITVTGATGSVKRVFDLLEQIQVQRQPHYLTSGHPQGQPMVQRRIAV